MQIHPVFYKKLLKLAPPDTKVITDIKLKDNKYMVKEIKDLQKIRR